MRAIIRRPSQRLLLTMLSVAVLSGCSGIQSNPVYKAWEHQAYSAYKVATPAYKNGILPELVRTVSDSGRHLLVRPAVKHTAQTLPAAPVVKNNNQELQYIEQYYGL